MFSPPPPAEYCFAEVDQLLLADCQRDGVSEQSQSDTQRPGSKELHVGRRIKSNFSWGPPPFGGVAKGHKGCVENSEWKKTV